MLTLTAISLGLLLSAFSNAEPAPTVPKYGLLLCFGAGTFGAPGSGPVPAER